jgi:hypothetical protein
MSPVSAPTQDKIGSLNRSPRRASFKLVVIAGVLCAILAVAAFGMIHWWPFTQTAVIEDLREAADSEVTVRTFREVYFPSPGCVLEGVIFHRGEPKSSPLITIERLTVRGSYLGIFLSRVSRITATGMHVSVPPFGTGKPLHTRRSKIMIDELVADGAAIEFIHADSEKKPLRFDIHEASLKNVGWSGPLTYRIKVHNPQPPGEVSAEGKFGVWNQSDPSETPIDGVYKFEQADLSVTEGISGTLSSTGKFAGKVGHIDISGETDAPDFEVKNGGHPVKLKTKFDAYVDGTKGDTFLHRVDADFWRTHIVAQGSIAKSSNVQGKTALIDFRSTEARIEDILRLFVKKERAPMSGNVILQAHAEIPPGSERFLKKVRLRGSFGISEGLFSEHTQQGVDKLSAGARGEKESDKGNQGKDEADPETVLSDLKGQVNLVGGIARFSDLSFAVPGADARMHGTYDLISHKIDLRGQMKVDTKISNTTTGAKAFLLKVMEPFFKKRRGGEIVPVRISGTYEHPTFALDLNDKKAQKVPEP